MLCAMWICIELWPDARKGGPRRFCAAKQPISELLDVFEWILVASYVCRHLRNARYWVLYLAECTRARRLLLDVYARLTVFKAGISDTTNSERNRFSLKTKSISIYTYIWNKIFWQYALIWFEIHIQNSLAYRYFSMARLLLKSAFFVRSKTACLI